MFWFCLSVYLFPFTWSSSAIAAHASPQLPAQLHATQPSTFQYTNTDPTVSPSPDRRANTVCFMLRFQLRTTEIASNNLLAGTLPPARCEIYTCSPPSRSTGLPNSSSATTFFLLLLSSTTSCQHFCCSNKALSLTRLLVCIWVQPDPRRWFYMVVLLLY